jgi:hypothetical protein
MRRQRATYEPRGCPLRPAASRSASLSPEPLALKKKSPVPTALPACLGLCSHALGGWANAPRCGETRLPRNPSACPAGPWRVPVRDSHRPSSVFH